MHRLGCILAFALIAVPSARAANSDRDDDWVPEPQWIVYCRGVSVIWWNLTVLPEQRNSLSESGIFHRE
jgi:hypothetical protein